jgi:GTPase SAR1 family protein
MKTNESHDEIIKIIIIGDSNVGKTAILNRFC